MSTQEPGPKEQVENIEMGAVSSAPWFTAAWEEFRFLFTTREGIIGNYDYAFLFTPDIYPFNKKYKDRQPPFFGISDRPPLLLTILLGLQHALAMIGGIITPPLLIAGASGANLSPHELSYLISASLIISGIFSFFQIKRFQIFNTGFFIGTGMLTVVGESFSIVPIAQGFFANEYESGRCEIVGGKKAPCPEAYGKLLGTVACVMTFQLALSLVKPKYLMRLFPKLITGMVLVCIGASLVTSAIKNWAGGSGCMLPSKDGKVSLCPSNTAPKPLPWGHPSLIGLGFSVYAIILLVELFGSPFLRNAAIACGLVVGAIISSATGYIDPTPIRDTPQGRFLWTVTFPLGLSGSLVLPLMACCVTTLVSCLGDVVATAEVSGCDVDDEKVNSRVQGGLTADAVWSILAPLATTTPTVCFAQNVGVISLTNCASRRAGYACCAFLILAGVASRFGAAIAALPASVIGGMTTFLFTSIVVSGIKILAAVEWNRRNRFIATAALVFGLSDLLVPSWAAILLPKGGNMAFSGFKDGVSLMLSTSYCIVALVGVLLHCVLPDKKERPELPKTRED